MKRVIILIVLVVCAVIPKNSFADTFISKGIVNLHVGYKHNDRNILKMLDGDKVLFTSRKVYVERNHIFHNEFKWSILDNKNRLIVSGSGNDLTGINVQKIVTDTNRVFYEINSGHVCALYVLDKKTNVCKLIDIYKILPSDMSFYWIKVVNGRLYFFGSDLLDSGVGVLCYSELLWDDSTNHLKYKIPKTEYKYKKV